MFFLAGFETSSTTLSFCLHEMAVNQDIQKRVFDEINETAANYGLPLSYEAISSMGYLDQCVKGKFFAIIYLRINTKNTCHAQLYVCVCVSSWFVCFSSLENFSYFADEIPKISSTRIVFDMKNR